MLPLAFVILMLTSLIWSNSHGKECLPPPREGSEAELSTFTLRKAPSLTKPVVYDACKQTIFLLHFRRGGGTTLLRFLQKGIERSLCKSHKSIVNHFETYENFFHKYCWSLETVFLESPPPRPVTVVNLRDPFERMISMYNFEKRYARSVGFEHRTLPKSASPVWVDPPEKFFERYPDNFYVRVLCCANNHRNLLAEKIGRSHLSRAMKVLEHEVGIIAIFEWFGDPRFKHYLYSTLNATTIVPFECFEFSYDMDEKHRSVLGKIKFTDPEFEESWRKNNSLDYELYYFARRLAWQRLQVFWNVSNGELFSFVREPRGSNDNKWKVGALRHAYC